MSTTEAQRCAANFIWEARVRTGEWPLRHELLIKLDDAGFTLGKAAYAFSGVNTAPEWDSGSAARQRARLSMDGLALVDAAEQTREPFGAVAGVLAARFISSNGTPGRIEWSDFRALWPDQSSFQIATELVRLGLESPFSTSGGDSEGKLWLEPRYTVMAFEGVKTFSEFFLRLNSRTQRLKVGDHPFGDHRQLLLRIFEEVSSTLEWPRALDVALRERALGSVETLCADLSEANFLKWGFQERSDLKLGLRALALVDLDGKVRNSIVKTLRFLSESWIRFPGREVSTSDIEVAVGEPARNIKLGLRFIDDTGLLGGHTLRGEVWTVAPNEFVLPFRRVNEWEQAAALLDPLRAQEPYPFVSGTEEPAPVVVPDLKLAREQLVRVVTNLPLRNLLLVRLQEFEVLFKAQAWQSSLILLGSVAEGVLLEVLSLNKAKVETRRTLDRFGLGEMVAAAGTFGLLDKMTCDLSDGLKEFRDLVHPNRATASSLHTSRATVDGCVVALNRVIDDLHHRALDGRLATFEKT